MFGPSIVVLRPENDFNLPVVFILSYMLVDTPISQIFPLLVLLSSKHNKEILFFERVLMHMLPTQHSQSPRSSTRHSRKKRDTFFQTYVTSLKSLRLSNQRPIIQSHPPTCHQYHNILYLTSHTIFLADDFLPYVIKMSCQPYTKKIPKILFKPLIFYIILFSPLKFL